MTGFFAKSVAFPFSYTELAGKQTLGSVCLCPPLLVLGLQRHATDPSFHVGSVNLSSDSRACVASTWPIEPSSPPQVNITNENVCFGSTSLMRVYNPKVIWYKDPCCCCFNYFAVESSYGTKVLVVSWMDCYHFKLNFPQCSKNVSITKGVFTVFFSYGFPEI